MPYIKFIYLYFTLAPGLILKGYVPARWWYNLSSRATPSWVRPSRFAETFRELYPATPNEANGKHG